MFTHTTQPTRRLVAVIMSYGGDEYLWLPLETQSATTTCITRYADGTVNTIIVHKSLQGLLDSTTYGSHRVPVYSNDELEVTLFGEV